MTSTHPIAWFFLLVMNSVYAASYEPDILEFTASSDLAFPSHTAFALTEQATVEMWVASGWQDDPDYDPVLLYHASEDEHLYVLSMLGDQSGLSLQAGESVDELPFSFSDGRLHHVVLINLGDGVALMVDGQILGRFNINLPTGSGSTFRLGSAPGPGASFVGAIGGLRIWDIAVEQDVLITYALADIFSATNPHPDIDSLTAYSDLHNNTIELMPEAGEIQ